MSDLISRTEALNAFDTNIDKLIVGGSENAKSVEQYLNGVIDKIKQLPIKEYDWIPCSEILAYLRTHQDIENYVILDDTFFDDFDNKEIEEHLVLTNREIGLTDGDVKNAIKILLKE